MGNKKKAKERILESAKEVFFGSGFHGARMQDIADRAEINRAMLHYYYSDKETLFKDIFKEAAKSFFNQIKPLFESPLPLLGKIKDFIHRYIDLFIENEHLPGFILRELSADQDWLIDMIKGFKDQVNRFKESVVDAIRKNEIREVNPDQLFIDLISLCAHPFVAKSMLQTAMSVSDEEYKKILIARKKEVSDFFIKALKKPYR